LQPRAAQPQGRARRAHVQGQCDGGAYIEHDERDAGTGDAERGHEAPAEDEKRRERKRRDRAGRRDQGGDADVARAAERGGEQLAIQPGIAAAKTTSAYSIALPSASPRPPIHSKSARPPAQTPTLKTGRTRPRRRRRAQPRRRRRHAARADGARDGGGHAAADPAVDIMVISMNSGTPA